MRFTKKTWKITSTHRHLLRKPKSFFIKSNFDQILSWEQNITKALKASRELARKIS